MKKKILISLVLLVVLAIAVVINNQPESETENKIVIGAPLSLTGFGATDGQSIKRGIDLAVVDLAKEGIAVEIVYEDDATDPKRTIAAIQKLASVDKVQALIGPTWSFLLDAAAPAIYQHELVSYSPANTSEFISAENPYLLFGAIKNSERTKPTAEWLKSKKAGRVAIIVSKDAWGESNVLPLEEAVKQAGAEVSLVERIPFNAEADVMPTVITKIKAKKVDAILWTGYDQGGTILVKNLQSQKLEVPMLAASTALSGLAKNKTIAVGPADEFYYLTTATSNEFSDKYFRRYGEYPGTYADSAYDGVRLIVKALQAGHSGPSLAEYLRTQADYQGYQTRYTFDDNGDIRGGEWIVKRVE